MTVSQASHVCLVSPGHLSTNPRLVKEARALSAAGYKVSIVCGRYSAWGREQDKALADARWSLSYVPFGPVEASRRVYLIQSVSKRVAEALASVGFGHIRVLECAHSPASVGLLRATLPIQADLYIAHYVAALPAAAAAARRHRAVYGFDAEDFHLGDAPDDMENRFSKRIIRAIEGRYLPAAAYVTAASPLIADAYVEAYGIERPEVALNVFPISHAPANPTLSGTHEPGLSIYWFSQTIGAGRGLEVAIEAIALTASRPNLFLRGTPSPGYESKLRALAVERNVDDRLHFLPPAPPDEMEKLGSVYDLGYVGEVAETHNRQIALTNKIFSYLTGGVPILASDIASHLALAPELGAAMTLFAQNDPGSLARVIDQLLLDPVRLASARAASWTLGQGRFSWDTEQKVFLACVAKTLSGRHETSSAINNY